MIGEIMRDIPRYWLVTATVGTLALLLVLFWFTVFGPLFNRADYNNYNNSPQHVNAVAQRFADDCQQIAETSDPVAKKAIEQDIYQLSATVDVQSMQMPDGIRSCVNKSINDVSGGH
jgi:hypothetical protein